MKGRALSYLVERIKEEMFSPSADMYSFLPPSAYETAWVAMVASPSCRDRPMFPQCLEWILCNQREEGFWGEPGVAAAGECLIATLACIIALDAWNTGHANIEKGLGFVYANMEKIVNNSIPRWFAIVFPGMMELAQAKGLINCKALPHGCMQAVDDVFNRRTNILVTEKFSSCHDQYHPPLGLYIEALPMSYRPNNHQVILEHQLEDGSLFQSPSATACAFMITGDRNCLGYLQTMMKNCNDIVPSMFPVDQDLIKLCLVDHLRKLGCGEHFAKEIQGVMDHTYRNWIKRQREESKKHELPFHIYRDSLAFHLLRAYGYRVTPWKLCRFMDDKDLLVHIMENYTEFLGAMHGVYRAAHLMFPDEVELHNASVLFATKVLHKYCLPDADLEGNTINIVLSESDLQEEIEHELKLPWLARMDHLEHRTYIERNKGYLLWIGKTNSTCCRLSCSDFVMQLAIKNYTNRQSLYKEELEKLKRWSNESGLSKMGFGREKTSSCYLLASVPICLPLHSDLRMVLSKCAVIVTIADDFFDEKGSLNELESLTEAIQRWEGDNLSGHSKVIFDALNELVCYIASKSFSHHGVDVKDALQDLWRDVFDSWLKEFKWSRSKHTPSIAEYIEVAKISSAIQVIILSACYLMSPPEDNLSSARYSKMTKLTMLIARLLNDMQSYEKEIEAGKFNMVPLYMKENQGATAEDSNEYIRKTIERKEKEFLEIYMSADTYGDAPKVWKDVHLAFLKSFRMIYNTSNAYDSPTALLKSISKAFYEPLDMAALEAVLSPEKEMYEPMKKRWDVLWEKSNSKDGLLKSSKSTDYKILDQGKDRNALRDSKVQMKLSNNIKPSNDGRRSSKIWSISRSSPSTSHVAYITPSIMTTRFFLTKMYI